MKQRKALPVVLHVSDDGYSSLPLRSESDRSLGFFEKASRFFFGAALGTMFTINMVQCFTHPHVPGFARHVIQQVETIAPDRL